MTLDPLVCHDTDSYVLPLKKYYPAEIPVAHHQLRHLLSSPRSRCLYYAGLRDIYCVDLDTQKRTLIQELPFIPVCTATGHGWFCAGGSDNGYFAAFRLPDHPSTTAGASSSRSDLFRGFQRPHIRIERLGASIVNSVSIHLLPSAAPDVEDQVVAVLTNNDRFVRIYSLTQETQIMEETFPFLINHATLSPDGKMLVVVGDSEFAYFFERVDDVAPIPPKSGTLGRRYAQYKWHLLSVFELHRPPRAASSAYFTTAWSSTGTLCATASEHGFITIFDVRTIARGNSDATAIVAVVPSSNPNPIGDFYRARASGGPGAVRTMCFAPEPWDLLIWSEHNGRVCVGDLRNGLLTRQVVDLDPKADGVTKVTLKDGPDAFELSSMRDLDFDPDRLRRTHAQRLIMSGSGRSSGDHSSVNLGVEALLENEILQAHTQMLDWSHSRSGLSDEEQLVLDGLRTSRWREDSIRRELSQGSADTGSMARLRMEMRSPLRRESEQRRSLDTLASSSEASSSRLPRATPSRATDPSESASSSAWRTIEAAMERANDQNVFGLSSREERDRERQRTELLERLRAIRRLRPREAAGASTINTTSATINPAALSIAGDRDGNTDTSTDEGALASDAAAAGLSSRILATLRQQRELAQHRQSQLAAIESSRAGIRAYAQHARDGDDEQAEGRGTSGIALSQDGRVLYAATGQGIWELRLNAEERKFYGAVQMR